MNPRDFIYEQAYKKFVNMGYTDRDASEVAVDATRRWTRRCKGSKAIEEAIINGKRIYKQAREK